jgi:hypothetical protein
MISSGGQVRIDHRDVLAVDHHVGDLEFLQVENAAEHVAVVRLHGAFLVVQVDGAAQFLVRGFLAVLHEALRLDADGPEHDRHQQADGRHDGRKDLRTDPHGPGDAQCHAVGIGDGIGLGQHFAEDQHQSRW